MSITIALAQVNPCVGDLAGNAALVVEWSRRAAEAGAQVALFPEMALTGYPIEDLALRRSFQRAAQAGLETLASDLAAEGLGQLTVIVGSLGTDADGRPTNIAAVLREGLIQARYVKHRLPNYGVFDEYRLFAPGQETCVIEVDGARLGIAICEDIWQDDGPTAGLSTAGLDALCVLNGSPFELGKGEARANLAARRADEVSAPVCYVNLVGGQDDLVFDGGSFVVGRHGRIEAQAGQFTEELLLWRLGGDERCLEPLSQTEQAYRAVTLGLADYARKNGFRSVILGLSGGIDSALVAAIAADAVGAANVVGVSMPSRYSSDHSRDDAADLAERIGLDYRVQPINPMVETFASQLPLTGIAAENIQARVRGVILMALSNLEGHLVLATGNKSELATGYSTIYGDAVGGFAPIKDLIKTRVWELARWRNAVARARDEREPIPENSILKAPSAELRPGQVDQDTLPDYALLDRVLDQYIEAAHGRRELLAAGHAADAVDLALSLTDRAEWKRRQYPPGPKVTAVAFGRDRRLPITSRWREP